MKTVLITLLIIITMSCANVDEIYRVNKKYKENNSYIIQLKLYNHNGFLFYEVDSLTYTQIKIGHKFNLSEYERGTK